MKDTTDRLRAIKALGLRWTDLMLDLEGNPQPMTSEQSLKAVTSAMAFWAHPLLTEQNVHDLSVCLNRASIAQRNYECFGTWDSEDHNALGARTDEQRREFLALDVERAAFRLLHAQEPCISCVHHLPPSEWLPEVPSQTSPFRCAPHAASELDEWRRWNNLRKLTLAGGTA